MSDILERIRNNPKHKIIYIRDEFPSKIGGSIDLEEIVHDQLLIKLLEKKGIKSLYKFQAEAIKLIRSGHNVVISAGTGMGKTEAFLIPIIEELSKHSFKPNSQVILILSLIHI